MAQKTSFLNITIKFFTLFLFISCIGLFEDSDPISVHGGSSDEDTGEIIGRVVDMGGQAVSGVEARLMVLDKTSITDGDGYFRFTIKLQKAKLAKKSAFPFKDTLNLTYNEQVFHKESISGFTDTLPQVTLGSIRAISSFSDWSIPVTSVTATLRESNTASSLEMTAELDYIPDSSIYAGTLYYSYTSAETKYTVDINAFDGENQLITREAFYFSNDSNLIKDLEVNIPIRQPNDTLVVRQILNENGLSSVPIDTNICKYTGQRISALHLDSSSLLRGQLTSLPAAIQNLTELRTLDLEDNKLTSIPPEIGNLTQLRILRLMGNKLTSLPSEIGKLVNLVGLEIWDNQLSSLPPSIGNLTKLELLWAGKNGLSSLPAEIGNLINLTRLKVDSNMLSSLPPSIGNLTNLMVLEVSNNGIDSLPEEIGELTNLYDLNISFNRLSNLPAEFVNLANITHLDVNQNKLCELSESVENWIDTYSSKPNWESTQSCEP